MWKVIKILRARTWTKKMKTWRDKRWEECRQSTSKTCRSTMNSNTTSPSLTTESWLALLEQLNKKSLRNSKKQWVGGYSRKKPSCRKCKGPLTSRQSRKWILSRCPDTPWTCSEGLPSKTSSPRPSSVSSEWLSRLRTNSKGLMRKKALHFRTSLNSTSSRPTWERSISKRPRTGMEQSRNKTYWVWSSKNLTKRSSSKQEEPVLSNWSRWLTNNRWYLTFKRKCENK